ncbi:hypothetical protein GW796_09750 [archaeon]|nr:hypothetical protein [archaeon]
MQRLIVKVQYGDGYTYSGENVIPVVFSSKEEFIITLEDKIQEIKKIQDAYDNEYEAKEVESSPLIL